MQYLIVAIILVSSVVALPTSKLVDHVTDDVGKPAPCLLGLCCLSDSSTCVTEPYNLGCFYVNRSNEFCKDRFAPWQPAKLGLKYELYTPNSPTKKQDIDVFNPNFDKLNFNPDYKLVLVVHGYNTGYPADWMVDSRDAILKNEGKVNVILCYWTVGSKPPPDGIDYWQAASNTRVVGAIMAEMLISLKAARKINLSQTTVVGHSLGSHVAGFAGERLKARGAGTLGRVIGLDPAGPLYDSDDENDESPPNTRIDPTDASFVQCIHTNGYDLVHVGPMGCGTTHAWGHVDLYPNGGLWQPGCGEWNPNCNHGRSHEFFVDFLKAESDTECPSVYPSFQCGNYSLFATGGCITNKQVKSCNKIGYSLQSSDGCKGKYYFGTTDKQSSIWGVDYRGCQYNVALTVSGGVKGHGTISLTFKYTNGKSTTTNQSPFYTDNTDYTGTFQKVVVTPCATAGLTSVTLQYKHSGFTGDSSLPVQSIIVTDDRRTRYANEGAFTLATGKDVTVTLKK